MSRLCVPLVFVAVLGGCQDLSSARRRPEPLRDPGLPASRQRLQALVAAEKRCEIRAHGWRLWTALNSHAKSGGPIWETWWTAAETLHRNHEARFERTRQGSPQPLREAGDKLLASTGMSSVIYNDAAHQFIQRERLYESSHLDELVREGLRRGVAAKDRQIPQFPRESIVLKTQWVPIAAEGTTTVRVWTHPEREEELHLPWKWNDSVSVVVGDLPPHSTAVSLSRFYTVKLDTPDLVAIANAALHDPQPPVRKGDYAALVAMHVATKELDDWVWATFWWHPRPDVGEFGAGRPASVQNEWRNYVMDITLDSSRPADEPKPGFDANTCFNPWLEGPLSHGVRANCLSCHERAAWPRAAGGQPVEARIPLDHPYYASRMRLDYLWSLAREE